MNLDLMGYLTTSQIQTLHSIKGLRNTQRILKEMGDYLNYFRLDENVFYLSKKGREFIGSTKERRFTANMEHFVLRNEFIINKRISYFKFEPKIYDGLVPDAWYKVGNQHYFLEIDRLQKMIHNKEKVKLYKEYRDSGKCTLDPSPILVFVTLTEYRRKELRSIVNGMKAEIYTKEDII